MRQAHSAPVQLLAVQQVAGQVPRDSIHENSKAPSTPRVASLCVKRTLRDLELARNSASARAREHLPPSMQNTKQPWHRNAPDTAPTPHVEHFFRAASCRTGPWTRPALQRCVSGSARAGGTAASGLSDSRSECWSGQALPRARGPGCLVGAGQLWGSCLRRNQPSNTNPLPCDRGSRREF